MNGHQLLPPTQEEEGRKFMNRKERFLVWQLTTNTCPDSCNLLRRGASGLWRRGRQTWGKPAGEHQSTMQSITHTKIHLHLGFLDDRIGPFISLFPFEQFSSLLSLLRRMTKTVQLMHTTRSHAYNSQYIKRPTLSRILLKSSTRSCGSLLMT